MIVECFDKAGNRSEATVVVIGAGGCGAASSAAQSKLTDQMVDAGVRELQLCELHDLETTEDYEAVVRRVYYEMMLAK